MTTPQSAETPAKETLGFQAEVRELLRLMIHSLYSHKEIFLRELISNASDANDKLRFESLSNPALMAGDTELAIWIEADTAKGTLTLRDNGIGMSRAEVISNLGTIARSGTAEFFKKLSGDQQKDSQLIGQFGVGFYSAFIVADRVEVFSRRAGLSGSEGVRWESAADGDFTVESIEHENRGTTIVLHLKEDAKEFLDSWRLRSLVRRYSDHIAFPVRMPKEGEATLDYEAVNRGTALWARPKAEIKDEEYVEFFRHLTHDSGDPLTWSHNRVEGKRDYTSLIYVPGSAPFDLWQRDGARGLKLYVRRVFIMDDAEQFLPLYLRFVKGVLDSADLPLNVSRELLQTDSEVEAMRGALTRRVLELLAKLAKDDAAKYQAFWNQFGVVLKEGVAEDHANQEKLLPLLRFSTTQESGDGPAGDSENVSLAEYVGRMQTGQDRIYYVVGESMTAARSHPAIEALRAKNVEVLLLGRRIDAWVMDYVQAYEGKKFKDATRGDLELGELASAADKEKVESQLAVAQPLLKRVKDALGERVSEVRVSTRLKDSAAVLVAGEHDISAPLRRALEAAGQKPPETRPVLELNVDHHFVKYLSRHEEAGEFDDLSLVLYEQAMLAEGAQLPDPGAFVQRLNKLWMRLG
ncbi:MAG: molecular chaperone HtpG [Steroidobacteraceae bacterium]|nr:molecular chaperone HtpG [Steroidobacteraceae bacterium]